MKLRDNARNSSQLCIGFGGGGGGHTRTELGGGSVEFEVNKSCKSEKARSCETGFVFSLCYDVPLK